MTVMPLAVGLGFSGVRGCEGWFVRVGGLAGGFWRYRLPVGQWLQLRLGTCRVKREACVLSVPGCRLPG